MLVKCPDCELQLSDKAYSCPHCGRPMQQYKKEHSQSKKRKRLPNGFGQIVKINDKKLRKPYRASVSIGKTNDGKCIVRLLKPDAYFSTYNEAYEALIEYNKNPYDLDSSLLLEELYEKWSEEYFKTLKSDSSIRTITSAWAYCSSIYHMRVKDVRTRHIKGCIEEGFVETNGEIRRPSPSVKCRIKSLFNLMLDYAVEYELADRNYARAFNVDDQTIKDINAAKRAHIPFKDNEISILWENINKIQYVDMILFQCYSGFRPQELGLIELKNVDLESWTIVGGMKTDAGTNRLVPIHSKVRFIVKKYYDEALKLGSEYLFNCTDTHTHRSSYKFTYDKYSQRLEKIIDRLQLNPEHRAHDGRVHFVTMAKKANVDEYAIKYIVGHAISDITEKVYTRRDVEWLQTEIEKIK